VLVAALARTAKTTLLPPRRALQLLEGLDPEEAARPLPTTAGWPGC